jgi:hypothetical protein
MHASVDLLVSCISGICQSSRVLKKGMFICISSSCHSTYGACCILEREVFPIIFLATIENSLHSRLNYFPVSPNVGKGMAKNSPVHAFLSVCEALAPPRVTGEGTKAS